MTVREYVNIEKSLQRIADKEMEGIDDLVKIVYPNRKWWQRKPSHVQIIALVKFCADMVQNIHTAYEPAFNAPESELPASRYNFGWDGSIFHIAESGVFGDISAVYTASIHNVLLYLSKCSDDAHRLQAYQRQQNKK